MNKKYIFNSSMPRSGSELLQVILHQNPEIYGSPTSPLLEYWYGARANQELPENKSQPTELMRNAFMGFCRGGLDGYYEEITDRPIVCDKSRGHSFYYSWLKEVLGENPKMLCCVRDLREILVSMEMVYRNNRHLPIGPDNPATMENLTVEGRVAHWLNTQPVGLALQKFYDSDQQGYLDNLHAIRYEDLTSNPRGTMVKVYEYLEMPYFEHDFDNIYKEVEEDSTLFGVYGNHMVKSKIEYRPKRYDEILGAELSNNIVQSNQWYFNKFYS